MRAVAPISHRPHSVFRMLEHNGVGIEVCQPQQLQGDDYRSLGISSIPSTGYPSFSCARGDRPAHALLLGRAAEFRHKRVVT